MTLPLIHALEHANSADKSRITNIIKRHNENPKKVKEVINYVLNSNGINYAVEQMNHYKQQALDILYTFDPSPARDSLEGLVEYTINRVK